MLISKTTDFWANISTLNKAIGRTEAMQCLKIITKKRCNAWHSLFWTVSISPCRSWKDKRWSILKHVAVVCHRYHTYFHMPVFDGTNSSPSQAFSAKRRHDSAWAEPHLAIYHRRFKSYYRRFQQWFRAVFWNVPDALDVELLAGDYRRISLESFIIIALTENEVVALYKFKKDE
jgi:hypothetical protein